VGRSEEEGSMYGILGIVLTVILIVVVLRFMGVGI
jgi:hypothetical protein